MPEAASVPAKRPNLPVCPPAESSSVTSDSTSFTSDLMDHEAHSPKREHFPSRPEAIPEVSEPASPKSIPFTRISPPPSVLSAMLRSSPTSEEHDQESYTESESDGRYVEPAVVGEGIISQPTERTMLLLKKAAYGSGNAPTYGIVHDLEGQKMPGEAVVIRVRRALTQVQENSARIGRTLISPKSWDKETIWAQGIRKPANYVPPVILGLLLNILDALSYGKSAVRIFDTKRSNLIGMILFPLGQPVFADLGADGISMFYVSCIVSQLVYSLGGSIFRGGIGSEMVRCFLNIVAICRDL